MRKIALLAILTLVAVPAAFAEDSPSPTDQASALCKQQRTQMGTTAFKLLYGGASNSFGRCVSKLASTVSSDTANASKQCAKERADAAFATTHDNKTFAQFYGSSTHGNGNAFGKCVSSKAKALAEAQQESTIAAAKTCKAERTSMGALAFTTKYGGHSNAFGKCVSKTAKATP
jgi:hypothetical protein